MILSDDKIVAKTLRLAIENQVKVFDYDGVKLIDLWELHLWLASYSNSPELNFEETIKEIIRQADESEYDDLEFEFNGMLYEVDIEEDPLTLIF